VSDTSYKRLSVALLLLAVVFGTAIVYYNSALAEASTKMYTLQQAASQLQGQNGQLEQRLSALDQSSLNASVLNFNPVLIYDSSNDSVVMIQGAKIVNVLTLFGQEQSVESVIGSGFVVDYDSSSYVLTNYHVVDGAVNITVTFWNGDAYPANLIGGDALSDLAVISISAPATDLHPLQISSSSVLRVGMPVVAIGNPFGLSGSVTFGIISQLGRAVQYQSASRTFEIADIIQFSAPINSGNSGGPCLTPTDLLLASHQPP